ncbi:NAD(P)/FAD-dependent oxidoreductase [Leptothrix ochracea]|uniref:NAD(P)/FAD-dependent oxidoreductase n=3 Tax=Leptothrix ochracea TaxID=735331 RepID=UPI0034E2FC75
MENFDAVIVGAGAAGLFCAGMAGQRGVRVLLLDHATAVAEKIRISGGGRCNFTNLGASPANFLSDNPHFCRSALARYRPSDFTDLLRRHGVSFHEKHLGQLFCDHSSQDIIDVLLRECAAGQVTRRQPCSVLAVQRVTKGFELTTSAGPVHTPQLVIATGGLPIPQIGASDWGLRLARDWGLKIIETRPALVPLTFASSEWAPLVELSGLSLPARLTCGGGKGAPKGALKGEFLEDVLFTHRGLSGPGTLQISSYWRGGQAIQMDLYPQGDLAQTLREAKNGSRRQLGTVLAQHLPNRLAEFWLQRLGLNPSQPMAEMKDRDIERLAQGVQAWSLKPDGTEGWKKAEVMVGGVDTRQLSSQTMASLSIPGLHFIGEVVDVTGWLGGYNFQWAWASGAACAEALRPGSTL